MVQSSYKLCWLHSDYSMNFGADKCQTSSEVDASQGIPACHTDCAVYAQCKRAFELAGLPNTFWYPPKGIKISSEDVNAMATTQHVRRNISSFVSNGQNLWMYSDTSGNGKTYRAVTLASTYILNNVLSGNYFDNMVRYVYIPKYVSDFEILDRSNYESLERQRFLAELDNLYSADLVIWDELGYGSDSRIETSIIRAIINDRINNSRSNVFISGKSLQEVRALIGKGVYERINNCSLVVNFRGPDLRMCNIYSY